MNFKFSEDDNYGNEDEVKGWLEGEKIEFNVYIVFKDPTPIRGKDSAKPLYLYEKFYDWSCSFAFGKNNEQEVVQSIFQGLTDLPEPYKYSLSFKRTKQDDYPEDLLNMIEIKDFIRNKGGACNEWSYILKNLIEIQGKKCLMILLISNYDINNFLITPDFSGGPNNLYQTFEKEAINSNCKKWIFQGHAFISIKNNNGFSKTVIMYDVKSENFGKSNIYDPSFSESLGNSTIEEYEDYLIEYLGTGRYKSPLIGKPYWKFEKNKKELNISKDVELDPSKYFKSKAYILN